jgi:light-regulated signal transduction histidine kinase (bacteriophytochrome)
LFGRLAAKQTLETMMLNLAPEMDLAEGLTHFQPNLLDLIPVGGVTLWFGGKATSIGRTPNAEQVASLVDWLEIRNENVFDTDQLSLLHPPAAAYSAVASGVLAISLSKSPRDYVLWFLPAVARTVTWAGNPNKTEQPVSPGKRLTPRASFAAWRELVRDHSRAWQSTETEAAESLRTAVLVLRRIELYASEKAASRVHQDTLMAELDHRVKNILATIQALAAQSHADSDTIESFLATFEGRLRSMSRAHSLLTLSRWEGADLRSLITEEMAPFMGRPGLNVVIAEGETIILRPKAALALSLGIHELATNAAKYGALSVPDGCIKIDWRVGQSPEQTLVIHWRESGGPAVLQPARHGFGTTLIESSLSYELGGVVTLDFLAEGVSCTVVMPWDQVVGSYVRPAPVSPPLGSEVPVLTGLRVLVVEDNALVVQTTVGFLQKFGASVVGPAPRLTAATQLAEAAAIDIAMLDIDLDGTRVWPAADILARRGVPFLFVTGFAANLVVPPRFADRTVLTKPYSSSDLGAALGRLLATRPTVRPETEIQTQA